VNQAPRRVFCEYRAKHQAALFDFVEDLSVVPPTHHAAEHSVRHEVTAHKSCGGSRSTPALVPDLAGAVVQVGTNPCATASLHCRCQLDQLNR
jgi:hypothetical protein